MYADGCMSVCVRACLFVNVRARKLAMMLERKEFTGHIQVFTNIIHFLWLYHLSKLVRLCMLSHTKPAKHKSNY